MNSNMMMTQGVDRIIESAKAYYKNNSHRNTYMNSLVPSVIKNAVKRKVWDKRGVNIPPMLIASITDSCNLCCKGCYAQANEAKLCTPKRQEMTSEEWANVFNEAGKLGIQFVLLAGGEPTLRVDVLDVAAQSKDIIFPVFTNGVNMDEAIQRYFKDHANLIPIISIEGSEETTDKRRGTGVHAKITEFTDKLKQDDIMFGASITVTSENIDQVTGEDFIRDLHSNKCGVVIFVEYVPADGKSDKLVLNNEQVKILERRSNELKNEYSDMAIISFPGDEEDMGGCLASGRGFFHINPSGGAEPCPFSPYSRMNLKENSILEVLKSDYFEKLKKLASDSHEHHGGCTLFSVEENVKDIVSAS